MESLQSLRVGMDARRVVDLVRPHVEHFDSGNVIARGGGFPAYGFGFSTACFPCTSMGPGRPAYRLPIEVAARPQYAMAHSGSSWEMAVKVLAAAGNEKVCSIATARSNFSWTPS